MNHALSKTPIKSIALRELSRNVERARGSYLIFVKWCMFDDLDSANDMLNIETKCGWANDYLFISVVERPHFRGALLFGASRLIWLNTQYSNYST